VHPDVAATLGVLARLCEAKGDNPGAVAARREAATILERLWGKGHFRAVDAPWEGRTFGRFTRLSGEEGGKVGRAWELSQRAVRLNGQGKAALALPPAREAAKLYGEVLGEKHPHHAGSLNNLAALYQQTGEFRKALDLYRRALSLRREAFGERHP